MPPTKMGTQSPTGQGMAWVSKHHFPLKRVLGFLKLILRNMFIQVGIFLIVVHKMAKGGLLALHTQQVLVSGPGSMMCLAKTNLQQVLA